MEWFVVGLEAVAVETATESRTVLLTLEPNGDGLDGAMFICRATLSDGREVERTIALTVQGTVKYSGFLSLPMGIGIVIITLLQPLKIQ